MTETKRSTEKQRSVSLNDAYWAWLTEIARDSQNRGITVREMLRRIQAFDAIPTKDFLHKTYAKPIIEQQFFKKSSSKCTNPEIQQLIDQLTVLFSENLDTDIPFSPDMHNLLKSYTE